MAARTLLDLGPLSLGDGVLTNTRLSESMARIRSSGHHRGLSLLSSQRRWRSAGLGGLQTRLDRKRLRRAREFFEHSIRNGYADVPLALDAQVSSQLNKTQEEDP